MKSIFIKAGAAAGIVLLLLSGLTIKFLMSGTQADLSVETNYMFNLADKNKDGRISENELRLFQQAQQMVAESKGRFHISDNGEVVENTSFLDNELERKNFLERTMKKNSDESFRHK